MRSTRGIKRSLMVTVWYHRGDTRQGGKQGKCNYTDAGRKPECTGKRLKGMRNTPMASCTGKEL